MNTKHTTAAQSTRAAAHLGFLETLRDEVQARRAKRAADAQVRRELASYVTQSEKDELYAILSRANDADTAYLRRMLDRQRVA